jgi:hypothetical protein
VETVGNATFQWCFCNLLGFQCLQDTGEGLQALLHYADTKQLIAVSTSGSAAVYESSVNTGKAGITAADWGVVMKMKFAGAADGSKVQVRPVICT